MLSKVLSRPATPEDIPLISALHDRVFGPGRFARTAYRVREQKGTGAEISRFCRLAASDDNRLIAALRMSEISIGGKKGAILLGPLVVAPEYAGQGYGRALVTEVIEAAKAAGLKLMVLVGDEPYYGRFGFKPVAPGTITFPGPVNPQRILALELESGALASFSGQISGR
ncbi:MAG: N-acetyltransferase [Hyphomicrobium zavarzinii]|jgi:predicted N-acetyltransferase YhbS|uniref:GNAT family N-acetyltransferase n=1 Tax=Hyphomicrobium TaxID=81 RepID=UPI00036E1AAF|nr:MULTISPECIES: N-acetyltransferase [Hyphomicrobium]MBL8846689.1 N-acetyltransferase [Hyphomicrobium zavarzinii]WBT39899.1 N-acetyltransferase [Hyphomicrobium sp. DMF-1]HML44015.1 N-acetyltransferase [Hyphomicrobium zavarzinii]